jgi:integrase
VTTRSKRAANKRQLTELFVEKTKAVGLHWDSKQRGLVLRVRPSLHKSYYVVYSRFGRPRWMLLGSTAIPLAEARDSAAETLVAVHRGRDPAAERKAERGAGTFADLHAQYLVHAQKRNKSWQQADRLIRSHAIPKWGKLQVSAINRRDIKQMMEKLGDKAVLANQALAAVSAIFTWAVDEELVSANPCRGIKRNPVKSRERVLGDSEIPAFWSAFSELDPVRGAALKAILLTGQRPGEIAHMRAEHIKDGWWEMPGTPTEVWPGTKNGESHRVWIPVPARPIIAEAVGGRETGYVFSGIRGGPVANLDDTMRAICAKLGVEEKVTPHDLRRTFSTTLTGLKFDRDALNRVTNHKEGGIADVYDRHKYADENKRVMEAVAAKIMALVDGRSAKVIPISR